MVAYPNSNNRLNWGAVAPAHAPIFTAATLRLSRSDGELAYIDQEYVYRQIYYDVGGFASYPFSPVPAGGGVRRVYLHAISTNSLYTTATSYYDRHATSTTRTRPALGRRASTCPTSPRPWFMTARSSGPPAPLLGQSYRFEVTPTFGTLNYSPRAGRFPQIHRARSSPSPWPSG